MEDHNLNIVVIEDNLQMAEMISDYLQEKFKGSQVTIYNTGEKALKGISSEPDIVVLDYMLDSQNPEAINGLEVLKQLKGRYSMPVIFLTGQERTDVSANIIRYGAYDYIVKNQESFHRLEIIINNIIAGKKVKHDLLSQKKSVNALLVIVVAIVVGLVLMKLIW